MRKDMFKVIVERPRTGLRVKKPKGYQKDMALEDLSAKEGMRQKWALSAWQEKGVSDHLSPLRRFLHKQVGRPWDKVFSDICQHLNVHHTVQQHLRTHVDDFVARHVREIDGAIYPAQYS